MKKIFILFLLIISMFTINCGKSNNSKDIEKVISQMTTKDKISQMIMIACRSRNGVNFTSITSEVKELLNEYGFNGVILFAQNIDNNIQTYDLIKDLQEANNEGGHPGLFVAVDQEGGRVTRLSEGTTTMGNMALGAVNDIATTKKVASLIASEVTSLGFNVDFAPVADINNNPNNPVIGVRSFSDDKTIVSNNVKAFIEGFKEENLIGSLKHFPGHGDTDTDSHTGLPLINKTLDELLEFELYPFKENINDIEMVMTAHIVYPQIEKETYVSKSTGEAINLPATLSKTILTDVLREKLGYTGIIVTDALEMAAIDAHFDRLDVARLAINAGADILLMPVDISTKDGINELKKYIDDICNLVSSGIISIDNVNKAVERILKLKANYNLLNGATTTNKERVSKVGSIENHNNEWEITKKAITLLKNDNALPILDNDRVLIVSESDNELAIRYSLDLVDRSATVLDLSSVDEATLDNFDKVIFISQMGNKSYLTSKNVTKINTLTKYLSEKNKKSIILSTNLPYDVALFSYASCLVVCYSPKTMTELPIEDSQIKQYGPNIPVSIYMMFSDSNYQGHLPINIPSIEDGKFTNNILFERGYGLER